MSLCSEQRIPVEGHDWTNKGIFPWNKIPPSKNSNCNSKIPSPRVAPDYSAPGTFVRHLLVCPRLQTVKNMQAECWRHSLCLTSRVHAGNPTFFRSLTRITPCFCKRLSSLKACQKYTLWNSPWKYQISEDSFFLWKTKWKIFFNCPRTCLNFQNKYLLLG